MSDGSLVKKAVAVESASIPPPLTVSPKIQISVTNVRENITDKFEVFAAFYSIYGPELDRRTD